MSNRKLAFGLIGAGSIAQQYATTFERSEEVCVAGVVDVRLEAAKPMAERLGCPAFDSYQSLFEVARPLDAVVICAPPNKHEEISVYFLDRGVHVLCEKPLALDVSSAWRMLRAARASRTILTMASKFRFVDDVVRAHKLVTTGVLGEIVLFENTFTSCVPMSTRWNSDPEISGGGVLIDNGTHSVDIMRYFLGPLDSVQVVEGKRVQGFLVEDTALIFVRSVNGVMGRIDLSWSINKENASYINIYGSNGTAMVGWKESKYRLFSNPEWITFGAGYDKSQAFRDQIHNFARAIEGKEQLRITAEDALASVEVIETAYEALRKEHWLGVEHGSSGSSSDLGLVGASR